jgi:aspartyl/asparaginyl-tRNA synthetase
MFLVLRQGISTVQAVLSEEDGKVSRNMVRWAGNFHRETIVYVQGKIQKPGDGHSEVKQTSIHEVEISIDKVRQFPPRPASSFI